MPQFPILLRSVSVPIALAGVLLAAAPVLAGDIGLTSGAFGSGYALPLGGLAALLGFAAIGLWSGALGGGAVWQLPAIALASALIASLIAETGVTLPYAEHGLMVAVVAIGAMVALGLSLPLLTPPVVVALAAAFEGWPLAAAVRGPHLWPWAGFGVAALLAMAGGLGLAVLVSRGPGGLGVRALGVAAAATGVLMLLDRL